MNISDSAARPTLVVAADSGEIAWTPVTEPLGKAADTSDLISYGYLFGPPSMTEQVRELLAPSGPEQVQVRPWAAHTFTEGRDTLTDIAAAMVAAAGPRGLPCSHVRAALEPVLAAAE